MPSRTFSFPIAGLIRRIISATIIVTMVMRHRCCASVIMHMRTIRQINRWASHTGIVMNMTIFPRSGPLVIVNMRSTVRYPQTSRPCHCVSVLIIDGRYKRKTVHMVKTCSRIHPLTSRYSLFSQNFHESLIQHMDINGNQCASLVTNQAHFIKKSRVKFHPD